MKKNESSQFIIDMLREKLNQNSFEYNKKPNFDINDILNNSNVFSSIAEEIINTILFYERKDFLLKNNDYANGFYNCSLNTAFDKLNLKVPRTRKLNFFSKLLSKYNRNDNSFYDFVASLIYNDKSKQNIKQVIKEIDLNFSDKVFDSISNELSSKINDFKNTELPSEMPFVFIDAKHVNIKVTDKNDSNYLKVKKAAIYTVIGLNFNGSKQVLGFYINFGSESKAYWIKVFNALISRKLSKVLMFISDDFPGISDAIFSVYPNSKPQKCLVHFMRNVKRNLGKNEALDFIKKFKQIKSDDALDFDQSVSKFENLCTTFKNENQTFLIMF